VSSYSGFSGSRRLLESEGMGALPNIKIITVPNFTFLDLTLYELSPTNRKMMEIVSCHPCSHFTFCINCALTKIGKHCFVDPLKNRTLQRVIFGKEYKSRGATYSVFSILLLLCLRPIYENLLLGTINFSKIQEPPQNYRRRNGDMKQDSH
jgi:hypothetical protein